MKKLKNGGSNEKHNHQSAVRCDGNGNGIGDVASFFDGNGNGEVDFIDGNGNGFYDDDSNGYEAEDSYMQAMINDYMNDYNAAAQADDDIAGFSNEG